MFSAEEECECLCLRGKCQCRIFLIQPLIPTILGTTYIHLTELLSIDLSREKKLDSISYIGIKLRYAVSLKFVILVLIINKI